MEFSLPPRFSAWFEGRGWTPRRHQLSMIEMAKLGKDALLIAPTGGGKTLAGFLPSLIELAERPPANTPPGLHTLYISPLKALAVDVQRNLLNPVAEMGLPIRIEARTGDTGVSARARQRLDPPDILLTTPEQLALFCAWDGARAYFEDLRCVIIDEAHAMHGSKRGDLLALDLARLSRLAPNMRRVGLSATVDEPEKLRDWLGGRPHLQDPLPLGEGDHAQHGGGGLPDNARKRKAPSTASRSPSPEGGGSGAKAPPIIVRGEPGAPAVIEVLLSENRVPWAGHTAQHAMDEVYDVITRAKMALVFVNTRWQAEFAFQELWRLNEANLPIGLHHGSLAAEQRRRVEAAMARGDLRAVVCTSTLDLGIDWGDVDLVIQLAAPKGASRLVQRIGRANHRLDEPSRALLVPASRFEMLECRAAADAVAEGQLDGEPFRVGALDVLAQHVMGCACAEPFDLVALYDEVRTATPFANLTWEDYERVVDFVSTGGYALKTYDRFKRIVKGRDGKWKVRNAQTAQRHRMNVGAIVGAATLNIRLPGRRGSGRKIGEAEEWYFEQLSPGDTFIFAGAVWRFEGVTGVDAIVTASADTDPKVPSWGGSKFPLSTSLAKRVRRMMHDEEMWATLPVDVCEWLTAQKEKSSLPGEDDLLIETFPRGNRHYMVCYPFEGRLAHGTLAMLLTRRLDRLGVGPLGYLANDYSLSIWSLKSMADLDFDSLFEEDILGDDLEDWLAESFLMKRSFRNCALVSGLIERRFPGQEKSGRQVTFSADLIYDVLRRYQPDHLLLSCARADAANGLLDIGRLGEFLARVKGRIRVQTLDHVSPFAVPVMMEIGKERAPGSSAADLILESASDDDLIAEAMG
jgi:ATP-dependent Lhr-like helicase